MLRGQQLMEDISKELECPICLERLSNPRCLACNHVYCLQCLESLESATGVLNSVICPECRYRTTLGENQTVADLHRPVPLRKLESVCDSLEEFVRTVGSSSLLTDVKSCEFCKQNEENKPYAGFCLQCRALLCQECTEQHGTLFQGHPVSKNVKFCNRHTSKVSTMFCGDCTKFVCHLCAVAAPHVGHSVDPLNVAVTKQKRNTDRLMNTAATFIASLHDLDMNVDNALRDLRSQAEVIFQQITEHNRHQRQLGAHLVQKLQRRIASQEAILREFQGSCNDCITQLNDYIQQFEHICADREDTFAFIADILDLNKSVEEELEHICYLSVEVDLPTYVVPVHGTLSPGKITTGVTRTYTPSVVDNEAIGTRVSSATQDGNMLWKASKDSTTNSFLQKHTFFVQCCFIVGMSMVFTGLLLVINICSNCIVSIVDTHELGHHLLSALGLHEGFGLEKVLTWKGWFTVALICSFFVMTIQKLFTRRANHLIYI